MARPPRPKAQASLLVPPIGARATQAASVQPRTAALRPMHFEAPADLGAVARVLASMQSGLNGLLKLLATSPLSICALVQGVPAGNDGTIRVLHRLGRVPKGWYCVDAPGTPWEGYRVVPAPGTLGPSGKHVEADYLTLKYTGIPVSVATTVGGTVATTVTGTVATSVATTVTGTVATAVGTTITGTVATAVSGTVGTTITGTVATAVGTTITGTVATAVSGTVGTTITGTVATAVSGTVATTVTTTGTVATVVTPTFGYGDLVPAAGAGSAGGSLGLTLNEWTEIAGTTIYAAGVANGVTVNATTGRITVANAGTYKVRSRVIFTNWLSPLTGPNTNPYGNLSVIANGSGSPTATPGGTSEPGSETRDWPYAPPSASLEGYFTGPWIQMESSSIVALNAGDYVSAWLEPQDTGGSSAWTLYNMKAGLSVERVDTPETGASTLSASSSATSTPSLTATSTPSLTATSTPSLTATSTPSLTATSTATSTPSLTATSTPSLTATSTPSLTATSTATSTPSLTATSTATSTPSLTATSTPSLTATSVLTDSSPAPSGFTFLVF